eukprot:TRINITY_DN4113_c0_g1_i1.p1 TRINITY_DN4113_c0_g1~~TRINITY_DN4113_c0_g1_i1.p1  ORF type:complete len:195 (-),score=69.15 TRINITY_DN4113_c0_g1_i1:58-642(-)
MGENAELQSEELEVMKSIYEGDELYSSPKDNRHLYKFGEDTASRSFILEINWGPSYPSDLPDIKLDSFYNKHVLPPVKEGIIKAVKEEAEQFLGMSMTYSLFEWVRESLDTLLENQPESLQIVCDEVDKLSVKDSSEEPEEGKQKVKKEQMTKGQKRAAWKKGGMNEDDRERGWNWVDVVRHLHQTGGGADLDD